MVNELNLDLNSDYNMTFMNGYNFKIDNLYEKNGIGRTGIWINKNLVYDRLFDIINS